MTETGYIVAVPADYGRGKVTVYKVTKETPKTFTARPLDATFMRDARRVNKRSLHFERFMTEAEALARRDELHLRTEVHLHDEWVRERTAEISEAMARQRARAVKVLSELMRCE